MGSGGVFPSDKTNRPPAASNLTEKLIKQIFLSLCFGALKSGQLRFDSHFLQELNRF